MPEFSILQQPSEGTWKVKLNEEAIPGYFRKNAHNDQYHIIFLKRDGNTERLRTEPHSREGAACLLLYQHYEQERKRIDEHKVTEQLKMEVVDADS